MCSYIILCFFFFNDTATTEIYTLSLHDALPIFAHAAGTGQGQQPHLLTWQQGGERGQVQRTADERGQRHWDAPRSEEHTSELQSRHISYAVFCLKKKKNNYDNH